MVELERKGLKSRKGVLTADEDDEHRWRYV
jgi:hypothetical protein